MLSDTCFDVSEMLKQAVVHYSLDPFEGVYSDEDKAIILGIAHQLDVIRAKLDGSIVNAFHRSPPCSPTEE